jgi:hypothetical protein
MSGFFEATRGLMVWNPPSTARTLGLTTDVVRDYDASGSTTINTGSMTAGSNTLTLASPGDFRNGQGIAVTEQAPLAPYWSPPSLAAPARLI